MEIYVSDIILCSINDVLENILAKDIHFLPNISLYYRAFSTGSVKKECLFLCYVIVGKQCGVCVLFNVHVC